MNKKETQSHKTEEKEQPYIYGDALAKAFGVSRQLILSTQAHILASLAGANPQFKVFDSPMPFRSGGMIIAGDRSRIGGLVDQLLVPVHELQRIRLNAAIPLGELIQSTETAKAVFEIYPGAIELDEHLAAFHARRDLIHNLGTLHRNRYAATHPLLLIEAADPATVLNLVGESKDASPLWFDRGCLLGRAGKKTVETILPWLQGHHVKPGKNTQFGFSRIGYLTTLGIDDLSNFACDNLESLRMLQSSATLLLLSSENAKKEEDIDLSGVGPQLRDELITWEQAVQETVNFRDGEAILSATDIRANPKEMHRYRLKSFREFGKTPSLLDNQIIHSLMPKALFAVTILSSLGASFNSCLMCLACELQQYLYAQQVSAEMWIEDQATRSALDRDKAALIRALERKGPSSWPQLRRSLNKQGREDNEATINALIAEGRLSLDDCGVFHLKGKKEAA